MSEQANAELSMDRKYRHRLDRWWGDGERLLWVMLNPSTADETADDATIRRVRNFTKREGYDGFTVVNLVSFIATDPRAIEDVSWFELSQNRLYLLAVVRGRDVIAAWGAFPYRIGWDWVEQWAEDIRERAGSLRSLGVTKDGHPRHPVRLRNDTPLEDWPQ